MVSSPYPYPRNKGQITPAQLKRTKTDKKFVGGNRPSGKAVTFGDGKSNSIEEEVEPEYETGAITSEGEESFSDTDPEGEELSHAINVISRKILKDKKGRQNRPKSRPKPGSSPKRTNMLRSASSANNLMARALVLDSQRSVREIDVVLDTGSQVNVISTEILQNDLGNPRFKPSSESVLDFQGEAVTAVGSIPLSLSLGGVKETMECLVVETGTSGFILGYEAIKALKHDVRCHTRSSNTAM